MHIVEYIFSGKKVRYFPGASFTDLKDLVSGDRVILITDDNIAKLYPSLQEYTCITIPSGEQYKNQSTVDYIIQQLIEAGADRKTLILGVGGGVVTDVAGFAASIYMRGLRFAFVPTTVLAQVDASIGGKNGIDTGLYKNMVGLIRQPEFILFDYNILETLPNEQWVNGFAEIIKHACIKDRDLFELLEGYDLQDFRSDRKLLADLIQRNVVIKSEVVQHDEFETGDRKLLNFGHTIGHAIENVYELPHGHAVSIGIVAACTLSEQINDFDPAEKKRVIALLDKYQLSTRFSIDGEKIMQLLKMDKKRVKDEMSFILLDRIGEAVIKPIPLKTLEAFVSKLYTKEARV